jgi:hypothetical protein
LPAVKPLKSAAVQPLVEVDPLGSGGITMPPAGWRSPSIVPLIDPGFHSGAASAAWWR